jgi:phosphatidate phosphatase APP1
MRAYLELWRVPTTALALCLALSQAETTAATQQIVLAPGIATLQGRISRAPDSLKRRLLIDLVPLKMEPPPDRSDPHFRAMMGHFFSDSDALEPVSVKLGTRVLQLPPTSPEGVFSSVEALTAAEVAQLRGGRALTLQSLVTTKTPQAARAPVLWVRERGLTVITDIDDTIKVTEVNNPPARDRNTFARPFVAVAGMPALYRHWQRRLGSDIHFHAVSAGPWQLHQPLREFTAAAGFPPFTWQMRPMKITDRASFEEVWDRGVGLQRAEDYKVLKITEFMQAFPQRHVVLVGDSGERDPEAYARVLHQFPERVDWVLIRDVSSDPQLQSRGDKTLFQTPNQRAKLKVFVDAAELRALPLRATP